MSNRIQELADQARDSVPRGMLAPDLWIKEYNRIFAELVIKECIIQARSVGDLRGANDDMIYGADIAAVQISKYFGVEE